MSARFVGLKCVAVATLLIVGGAACSASDRSEPGAPQEIPSAGGYAYANPVWGRDGWIYVLAVQKSDSDALPGLARTRKGGNLEFIDVTAPGCPDHPAVVTLFALSEGLLELILLCPTEDQDHAVVVSYSLVDASVEKYASMTYRGGRPFWRKGSDIGYAESPSCPGGSDIVQITSTSQRCLFGQGKRTSPLVSENGDLFFAATNCGDTSGNSAGAVICRWNPVSRRTEVVASGFSDVRDLGVHEPSGRFVVVGSRGKSTGVWLVDGESVRLVTQKKIKDPALSWDGQLVVAVEDATGVLTNKQKIVTIRV